MFRRTYLAIASCVALVAFMGLSTSAYGAIDPHCEAIGNPIAIDEFTIDTPDSNQAYEASTIHGRAYACGSEITLFGGGDETLYNHADVGVPPGVQIANSDSVLVSSFAGDATVNVLYRAVGVPIFQGGVLSVMETAPKSECQNELDEEIVGATPGNLPGSEIVACLKGTNPLGTNWNWSVRDAGGKLWTTIGPMHGLGGIAPGLTFVDMNLCGYYGDVGGTTYPDDCGSEANGDQFQQKNGHASAPDCNGGAGPLGIYTLTATREDATVTPEASSCVAWEGPQLRRRAPTDVCQSILCKQ